ncbi:MULTISPECIES: RNase adapter RapZ [Ferrimicrobium]|uniref:RNase adapter RapZ n=1 Tax=Ferrimicrobium acidiphilum TaxID=121039 RepID=A0ABV3XYJ4_9ACTN|nr:RNase adapter RapZ [Ferrimicrobium sp.]
MSQLVVVAGMSGAGRSTAGAALEDAGWFVIDNLPLSLISKVVELGTQGSIDKLALILGYPSNSDFGQLVDLIDELKAAPIHVQTIFLEARDEVLISRFEGTKRRHPVTAEGLAPAIALERTSLARVRELADVIVETSNLSVHELRARTLELVDPKALHQRLQVQVTSFGYKHGIPLDADLVFDARFLPNPYWYSQLRAKTGLDDEVREFVLAQPDTTPFLERLWPLVEFLLPKFVTEGKSYLNVAVGCTGGRHRSVVVAEVLARRITQAGFPVKVSHRDLERTE